MKPLSFAVIAVMACLITGCSEQNKITTQDVADAMQLQKWTIKIPKDLALGKQFVLRLAYGDTDRSIGNKPATPGDPTTVLIWILDDGSYRCRIRDRKGDTSGPIRNFKTLSHTVSNTDQVYAIGETLMEGILEGSEDKYRVYSAIEDYSGGE